MRGQGRVYRPKVSGRETKIWWLDYGVRGVQHRESSGTRSKSEALELLRQRIGKRKNGTLSGRPDRVTLSDLKEALRKSYVRAGNRSWPRAERAFAHLEAFFGADAKAVQITKGMVSDYQDDRLAAGAARNSVRYESAILSASFGVALDADLLATKPAFRRLPEGEKRSGFFEPADFAAVVVGLPRVVADLVRFLRLTGWRRGEGVGLMWPQVDWDADSIEGQLVPGPNACIRIDSDQTKGDDAREFPISEAPELRDLLLERWKERDGLYVFHRNGKPILCFRKVWEKACTAAGVPSKLVHDLRRTAAREFRQAGVSEGEIMKLCGWKTRSMFDRYNVLDSADLSRAVARRFGAQQQTNSKQSPEPIGEPAI